MFLLGTLAKQNCWRLHAVPRLSFLLAESEGFVLPAPRTIDFVSAIHLGLPDSRLIENLHQHIRDYSRHQRHKGVARSARMYSCLKSGVLEMSRLDTVATTPEQVRSADCKVWRQPMKQMWKCTESTPDSFGDIMLASRVPPSPNPMSLFRSVSTWTWLQHYHQSGLLGTVPLQQAWLSRLLPQHVVVRDKAELMPPVLVILTGDYGAFVWQLTGLQRGADTYFQLVHTDLPCQWMHIVSLEDWVVVPYTCCYIAEVGILLRPRDHRFTIAQSTLQNQTPLTKDDLQAVIKELRLPPLAATASRALLIEHICAHSFDTAAPGYSDIVEKAKKAPDGIDDKLAKESDMGEVLADLVDEIMLQDIDNAGEVKTIKAAISSKNRSHLAQLQQAARAAARATKDKGKKPGRLAKSVRKKGKAKAKAKALVARAHAEHPPDPLPEYPAGSGPDDRAPLPPPAEAPADADAPVLLDEPPAGGQYKNMLAVYCLMYNTIYLIYTHICEKVRL